MIKHVILNIYNAEQISEQKIVCILAPNIEYSVLENELYVNGKVSLNSSLIYGQFLK